MLLAFEETALSKESRGPTSTRRRFAEDSFPCFAVLAGRKGTTEDGGGAGGWRLSNKPTPQLIGLPKNATFRGSTSGD